MQKKINVKIKLLTHALPAYTNVSTLAIVIIIAPYKIKIISRISIYYSISYIQHKWIKASSIGLITNYYLGDLCIVRDHILVVVGMVVCQYHIGIFHHDTHLGASNHRHHHTLKDFKKLET